MRYLNLVVAATFAWSAIIQYNDPDPWLWIAVYAAAAVMAGLAAFGRYPVPALVALGVACMVWMVTLAGGVADFIAQGDPGLIFTGMSPERPWVELTREFGGLAIIVASCVVYLWLGRRKATAEPA